MIQPRGLKPLRTHTVDRNADTVLSEFPRDFKGFPIVVSHHRLNDRSFGTFRRVLKVNEAIDRDAIEGDLADGVLTLTLHRSPEVTPRKIAIRSTVS